MLDGVKNLAAFAGIPFETALYCATMAPAKSLKLDGEIGEIAPGKRADLLLLDQDLRLCRVFKGGREMTL